MYNTLTGRLLKVTKEVQWNVLVNWGEESGTVRNKQKILDWTSQPWNFVSPRYTEKTQYPDFTQRMGGGTRGDVVLN